MKNYNEIRSGNFNTEDVLVLGAKTVVGVGVGLFAISFGVIGVAIAAETLIIPSLFTKAAGALGGGGLGLALGIGGNRKYHRK